MQSTLPHVRTVLKNTIYSHGCVFWLPVKKELSRRSVGRANGKEIIEEPNEDPNTAVWSPAEDSHAVYKNTATPDTRRFYFDESFRAQSWDENGVSDEQGGDPLHQRHVSAGSMGVHVELELERPKPTLHRSESNPRVVLTDATQQVDARRYSVPETASRVLDGCSQSASSPQSGFEVPDAIEHNMGSPSWQSSSDIVANTMARNSFSWNVWQPIDRVLKRIVAAFDRGNMTNKTVTRRPMIRFWTNTKGVVAVAIASI